MRITLNIDDDALEQAMKIAPGKSTAEVINSALREYVRRRRIRQLLECRGKLEWTGNIDQLRKCTP